MHSIEIAELGKRLWLPENMGECNKRQYLDMSKLVLMYQMSEISLEEFRVHGLYALLNMVPEESALQNIQDEKWENIYRLSELLNSFFTIDENNRMHLMQDYIHNPVKWVKYRLRTVYGPKDGFSDITYGQLEDGVGELNNFIKTGEMQALVKLFAIFYKFKEEKYGCFDMEKRIIFFEHLDVRYIYGFYLLFVSFFNFLTKECVIAVDGKELDLTILFRAPESADQDSNNTNEPESLGLRSTSFQLAESGVFGTLKELRETDAMTVLIRMYDLVIRAQREERERQEAEEEAKQKS